MAIVFPIPDSPDFKFICNIGGDQYTAQIRWNQRTESWYFSLLSTANHEYQGYEKITPLQPLVNANKTNPLTDGNFYVFPSITGTTTPLTRDNFGPDKDYGLYYLSYKELIEAVYGTQN